MNHFDAWNSLKQELDESRRPIYLNEKEVRLVHVGKNVRFEQDGKGESFVRPVLIIKRVGNVFFSVPMTTKGNVSKYPQFYYELPVTYFNQPSKLILSQAKPFDRNRFIKKIGAIHEEDFLLIKEKLKALLL